jgi:putative transcriptional regulator
VNSSSLTGSLAGQFLIAMPNMPDVRFTRAVIYICTHNSTGAMGLVINKLYGAIDAAALFDQLNIRIEGELPDMPIHYGGPIEGSRGFILHSDDYFQDTSMRITDDVAMTATMDILKSTAAGSGPNRIQIFLGYTGWSPGQLEKEIQAGGWLIAPHDTNILFDKDLETKWERTINTLGFSSGLLSSEMGHA